MELERCLGCGGRFPNQDGPTHRYMTSSPACWAAFGHVLAAEYSDPSLMGVHRLSVDAYAVQHPGDGSRRAIQSVGLHLARLHVQLDRQLGPEEANAFMLSAADRKASLPVLQPPASFPITIADVAPLAGTSSHERAVREWAQSAWDAWAHAHDFVLGFTAAVLRP
jgi:hypothetical protein